MRRTWKFIASALTLCMLCLCLAPCEAQAGLSRVIVDSSSFTEEINTAVWNVPEGDVTVQDGALLFSAESTKYTRMITKSMVQKTEESEELVSASFTLNVRSMPEGGEFILGFGLGNIESLSGEQGQVEVAFIRNGNLQVAVRSYENAGEAVTVVEPKATGISIGNNVKIAVHIKNDKTITIQTNGKTIATGTLPFDAEGSVGIFQTGACEVKITELMIESYQYSRPENSNFTETFEGDSYNTNLLFAKIAAPTYTPQIMSIQKYEENDVMWYENSGNAQIATVQQYSNFELTFDVPYLNRKTYENENGVYEKSMWFGVSFGDELMDTVENGFDYSPEMIYFDRDSTVKSYVQDHKIVAQSDKYPFFAEDETRGFSVKVSVVDAHVSIGMKWLDEETFTTIGEFDTADYQTPLGYVHIWTLGPANLAIDNIQMKNLDENPELVEVEYKTSKFEVPEDYDYQEEELVFHDVTEEKTPTWYFLIPCVAVLGIIIVGIAILIAKSGKKKGGRKDHEIS